MTVQVVVDRSGAKTSSEITSFEEAKLEDRASVESPTSLREESCEEASSFRSSILNSSFDTESMDVEEIFFQGHPSS